jgi:hypothetical protein
MFAWALRAGWSMLFSVAVWGALPPIRAQWRIVGVLVSLAIGVASTFLGHPWLWLALVAVASLPGLWVSARSARPAARPAGRTDPGERAAPREHLDPVECAAHIACAAVTTLIGVYALVTEAFGLEYLVTEPVARWLSSFATFVSRRPVALGPTYLALNFAIAYIVSCVAISLFGTARGSQRAAIRLQNLLVAIGGGVLLYLLLVAVFARFTGLTGSWFVALTACVVLLLAALIWVYASLSALLAAAGADAVSEPAHAQGRRQRQGVHPDRSPGRHLLRLAAGIALAALIAAAGVGAVEYGEVRKSVMFLSDQAGMFVPTTPNDFGDKSRPSFYWLPVYLEGTGYEVSWGSFNEEDLAAVQVVVAINVVSELSEDSRLALAAFIEGGGSLLVLADHTLFPTGEHPLDFVMSRAGIGLNFDTARSLFAAGWGQPGLLFSRHPVTAGIADEAYTQLGTGASLRVAFPARTVAAAKVGFIDAPDMNRPDLGYLGDLSYNVGERLGDIPMVAAGQLGKGKVLVFGDTSSFQNPSLAMSGRFIDQTFHWLARSRRLPVATWCVVLAVVLLGAAVAGALACTARSRPLTALAGALVACAFALEVPVWVQPVPRVAFEGGSAVIDRSHYPVFSSDMWGEAGLGGLYHNILRNQLLPIQMERFDADTIARAETVFIIGSQSPYTQSEITTLQRFVNAGGRLVVSAGWEERRGVENLLARFGMSIEPVPFGRFAVHTGDGHVHMAKAWPIKVQDPNASLCLTMWDKPVVVTRAVGQGRITVIGDSMFLFNPNLETVSDYNIGNIEFLRAHAFSTSAH